MAFSTWQDYYSENLLVFSFHYKITLTMHMKEVMELLMTTILCKHMSKLKEFLNSYTSSDKL